MRITALLTAVALSSCSLGGGIRRPDPPPYEVRPDCNDGYGRPVADTFIAASGLALAALATGALVSTGAKNSAGESTVPGSAIAITSGVVLAGLFGSWAGIGYPRVGACVEAVAGWETGTEERSRVAAQKARQAAEQARAAAEQEEATRRMEAALYEAAARETLRCPAPGEFNIHIITFRPGDSRLAEYAWAKVDVNACGRGAWCGKRGSPPSIFCAAPQDLDLALAQVEVETGCPRANIEQLQRLSLGTQLTYRLNACGAQYACVLPMDQTEGVTPRPVSKFGAMLQCKATGAAPLPPNAPPPPPPSTR